ncbi:MAG: hypothetical protein ACRDQ7_11655 [Haloechinothrix sp.]
MSTLVTAYLLYLLLSVSLTVVVATTLGRHGKVYLAEVFGENQQLANSVNQLLVVGFYLVSLGFVALSLNTDRPVTHVAEVFEVLSVKLGLVALTLGLLHLSNVAVFNAIRRRHRDENLRTSGYGSVPAYPGPAAPVAPPAG